jgi:hypothetical protein
VTEEQIARVRATAAEFEAAINDIDGVRAEIRLDRLDVTQIGDSRPKKVYRIWVEIGSEMVVAYP